VSGGAWPREWSAAMVGDVVRDGGGRAWTVTRLAGAAAGGVWVELDGAPHSLDARGVPARGLLTLHVPSAGVLVEMDEGPGWGAAGATDEAMAWASGLVADVLGVSGQGASDVEGGG
jgi:hypothetical protein